MKEALVTHSSPMPTGPYSQGIATDSLVFVAGQGPMDPQTKRMPEGIEKQTHQALQNVRSILGMAGASMDDVLKVTAHLADLSDLAAFNQVYEKYFSKPYPVRTTVGSQLPGILIEVDAIAQRPAAIASTVANKHARARRAARHDARGSAIRPPAPSAGGEPARAGAALLRRWVARLQQLEDWFATASKTRGN